MKLDEIRQLLRDYDKKFHFRRPERIKQLRHYLKRFENHSDKYVLTATDVFDLLKAIPNLLDDNRDLQPIDRLKDRLDSDYLLWIHAVLGDAGLINPFNFSLIYNLPGIERRFLVNLFCQFTPDTQTLPGILAIAAKKSPFTEEIEHCLRFLHQRDQLTKVAISLLESKAMEAHSVLNTLEALDAIDCLNDACLGYLTDRESLYQVGELLALLNRIKMPVTSELIAVIASSSVLNYLVEILTLVHQSGTVDLTPQLLTELLKRDLKFFFAKKALLALLKIHDLLDNLTWHHVLHHDIFAFRQTLEILASQTLLKDNKELVNRIINKKIDCYRLYRSIGYLQKAGLLTQQSLDACLQRLPENTVVIPQKDLLDLFKQWDEVDFYIKQDQLTILLSLSSSAILRLRGMVINLIRNQLLNEESFARAFQRVSEKLPPVEAAVAHKKSRKVTQGIRSETGFNTGHVFFNSHDGKEDEGGFGRVKKGFASPEAQEPVYSIKTLNEKDQDMARNAASREVRHHRLLGRQAFYYLHKESTRIVADWQQGKGLHHYTAAELLTCSMKTRLTCLRQGLVDLNHLHAHGRVHGDIKEPNFIVDLKARSMRLIDFGATHRVASRKTFAFTPVYADPYTSMDHYCRDMYAMGIVAMRLFPDLLTVRLNPLKVSIEVKKTRISLVEHAVLLLMDTMMRPDFNRRCTSEGALSYCDALLKTFDKLDKVALEGIKKALIPRGDHVEDVLRM